ncbi:MAG: TlpA family protein disulfide reductase [Candidatus Omnitrophica bacterium]|nr:TlpA family protein disulfide reductase [Candidatus Omnitrophota bacterium]
MSRTRGWWAAAALTMLAGCGPSYITWQPVEPSPLAQDFSLPDLNGALVALSDFEGQIVIMEFWATWCGPCRMTTPSLEHIYRKFREQGVAVLLVNEKESPDTIQAWARGRFTAPILLDREGRVGERYSVWGLPRLLVIDQEGYIRFNEEGYGGGLERNLELIIKALQEEAAGAAHG